MDSTHTRILLLLGSGDDVEDGKTMDLVTSTIPVQEVLSVFGKHAKKLQEAEDALN